MAHTDARQKIDQIRRHKNKNGSNTTVRDLRELIARRSNKKGGNHRPAGRVLGGRINKERVSSSDLRETNRKLAARKTITQAATNTRSIRNPVRVTSNGGPYYSQQPIYVPPHLQQQQPTYIIASAPGPTSNLAMDKVQESQGATILVSNLMASITESDIIELFGDIGTLTEVIKLNPVTAFVRYRDSSDAVKAVKVYHNRLLDGTPMMVNMMPNSATSSSIRSRIGHSSILE